MTVDDRETAVADPYRSVLDPSPSGFPQVLRAEWTKFWTVRGWVIALGVAAAVAVVLSILGASGSHSGFCTGPTPATASCVAGHPAVTTGPGGEPVADSFTFVRRTLTGDGTITARVTSLTGRHTLSNAVAASPTGSPGAGLVPGLAPWAKAGLILGDVARQRVGTDACSLLPSGTTTCPGTGAPYAAVMATGGHGIRMQYDFTHDLAGTPGAVNPAAPTWLRLTRTGDVVTGYESVDGSHWSEVGNATLPSLTHTVQVGLFVTSPQYFPAGSNNGFGSLATANFDRVHLGGGSGAAGWHGTLVGANSLYPTFPGGSWRQEAGGSFVLTGSGDIAPLVGGIVGKDAQASVLIGGVAGLLVLLVLATVFVTSEYRRGLIRTTFTASPRRGLVLAAKAVVIGSVAFVAGMVGTAAAEVVSRHILAANGNYLFPLSGLTGVRVAAGTGLVLGLAAVLSLAIATALRRSAGAVVTGVVLFVLPFVLGTTLPAGASDWLLRLTPMAAFAVQGVQPRSPLVSNAYTMVNGYYSLAPWAGLLVLCAYVAGAMWLASWLLRRRDV